jgi:hypothetical protein
MVFGGGQKMECRGNVFSELGKGYQIGSVNQGCWEQALPWTGGGFGWSWGWGEVSPTFSLHVIENTHVPSRVTSLLRPRHVLLRHHYA